MTIPPLMMNTPRLPDKMRFHPILVGVVVAAALAALTAVLINFIDVEAQLETSAEASGARPFGTRLRAATWQACGGRH